jgi:hypothetical protein
MPIIFLILCMKTVFLAYYIHPRIKSVNIHFAILALNLHYNTHL